MILKLSESVLNVPLSAQGLMTEFAYWSKYGPGSSLWFGRTMGKTPPDMLMQTYTVPSDDEA